MKIIKIANNEKLIEKAVKFLINPNVKGPISWKMEFLKGKGLTDNDITEVLNRASGGELLNQV